MPIATAVRKLSSRILTVIRRGRQSSRTRDASNPAAPHIVIVGGGFGGINAAKQLRHAPVRVTLIDQHNYHVFQPLLYQVATASLSPSDIATPIRSILRSNRNTEVILARVESIDVEKRRVMLDNNDKLTYDFLIVATGVEPAYFGHPEWRDFAPGLKNIDDAVEIRNRIYEAFERAERRSIEQKRKRPITIAIVGGGATGVELAGAIAEIARNTLPSDFRAIDTRATRVLLINSGERILKGYPDDLSDKARRDLENLGVEIAYQKRVTDIRPGRIRIGDDEIDVDSVIWAAGVSASPLAGTLGAPLNRSGQVEVERDLSIPGCPEVFVVGDLASISDDQGDPLPGVAQVAIQGGQLAAENIQRLLKKQPTLPFKYFDKGMMATVGRGRAVAVIFGRQFDGLVAWTLWAVVHVWSLIEFRNRITVMLQWFWIYLTQQRSSRLIVGELRRATADDSPRQ